MSKIAEQVVKEQESENAPLDDEDLEKVTGGTPSLAASPWKLMQAQNEVKKSIIANLRV